MLRMWSHGVADAEGCVDGCVDGAGGCVDGLLAGVVGCTFFVGFAVFVGVAFLVFFGFGGGGV